MSDPARSTDTPAPADDPLKALERARESFAAVFGNGRLSLEELRSNLDSMMLSAPLAEDVAVQETTIAGVHALRVSISAVAGESDGLRADDVLIWFHGGGYVMGSAHGYRHAAAALARATGMDVILPDYRLAPEAPFPAAVEDAVAITNEIVADHGAAHTFIGGDSAGGGLALATLIEIRRRGDGAPAAATLVSPLADFTLSGESIVANRETDPVITEHSLRLLAKTYLQGQDPRNPLASPVFGDLAELPPILLLASDSETLLDDAVRIERAIRATGGSGELSVYPDTCHAWTLFTDFLPQARQGVGEIGSFLERVKSRMTAAEPRS